MTRQQEYEMQAADARRRWEQMRRQEKQERRPMPTEMPNTLGPQEDVVESRRRRRSRVVMAAPRPGSAKSQLTENILLLILLVGSIYGLYRLSIYILNQS